MLSISKTKLKAKFHNLHFTLRDDSESAASTMFKTTQLLYLKERLHSLTLFPAYK